MSNIRNFSIIAHIDHGKSTLADRMLEITKTVEDRKMREQYLDQMPLERERGITIKMQPVRMEWKGYILNLIDTPGHIDFSYEVSRALAAVEGAILLVDATQGVQAQTISNVELARSLNLKIIPVINKIDLPHARIDETADERKNPRALIFDFDYSLHRGIISHVRVFDGEIKKGDRLRLFASKENFIVGEVGFFRPELKISEKISAGEIGYIVTNIKEAKVVRVGDTILDPTQKPLPGYKEVKPVVFSSLFPERQDDFEELRRSLERLRLSDASLSFEEESSGVLGRGFRC